MIRNFFKRFNRQVKLVVTLRPDHIISRNNISPQALKVLYRLKKFGFEAYIVGGGVRDLLLERAPKDFDVVTNAHPEEVKKIFSNCRLIGKRFRLAHVYFRYHAHEVIEVATFRAAADDSEYTDHGMIKRDNVYGKDIKEDIVRRDFTINALYYNIADFSIIDGVEGLKDLKQKNIRMIGDPMIRFQEDPVRMLRAIRFASKLDFNIHAKTAQAIKKSAHLLENVSPSRLFDESMKLLMGGQGLSTYQLLKEFGLLLKLFPLIPAEDSLVCAALANTDHRVQEDKPTSPGFLIAVFLWSNVQAASKEMIFYQAVDQAVKEQQAYLNIPKRMTLMAKDIWFLQNALIERRPKRIYSLISHPYFRAAYDFLLLRADQETQLEKVGFWWQQYQQANNAARLKMIETLRSKKSKRPYNRKDHN